MRHPQTAHAGEADGQECRCMCGSLLARVVPGGVELKCRRCKRLLLVPWEDQAAWPQAVDERSGGARGAPGESPHL